MTATYPFPFDPAKPFVRQAGDWIADVFYDVLPEAGFEVRDEQIFMAFQLERAYAEKMPIFAEAGVGTGKTLVYLLYAIAYARYVRKPAVIACADESLIEQLVKPEGDIAKLSRHLNLTVDARLGKSRDQYICLNKLDEAQTAFDDDADRFRDVYRSLPEFVRKPDTLQTFHPYGDRKHYPDLTDEAWSKIGWDVFQDCLVCDNRHRCGQTLSRDYYRKSADLIVCSHDFYMEHVWTYESRKREGQLPLLPEHSSVVFDEGHLLETAAQSALTYRWNHALFEAIVTRLLEGEIRESLAVAIEASIAQSESLFALLERSSRPVPGSDRREIDTEGDLLRETELLRERLAVIDEELVYESGLYSLNEYGLKIVEEHLDMIQHALGLLRQTERPVVWGEYRPDGLALVIMPRNVRDVLKERVFAKKMPIVFSSATLSVDGSFDYMARGLGLDDFLSFSVPSPYDYERQMKAELYPEADVSAAEKTKAVLSLIRQSEGRALVLFPTKEELAEFRKHSAAIPEAGEYRLLFEGTAEISHLVSEFQRDEPSVLCAATLWEGLDIPGPSLSHVIVWSLPFPPDDPVFAAKRNDAERPFEQVDMPYMLLRLKQGIGRLIRTRDDRGTVSVIGKELRERNVREQVRLLVPHAVERTWP
nr:ATP-dependent DNA helicase [Paenibacillus flagellatus]